mmetsp:Transcript_11811/g.33921  ORF Transcript_11811/g.33921 Transcript_11811/m.33921 type:complete len:112 (-) Transcript_11811:1191-1526(-)
MIMLQTNTLKATTKCDTGNIIVPRRSCVSSIRFNPIRFNPIQNSIGRRVALGNGFELKSVGIVLVGCIVQVFRLHRLASDRWRSRMHDELFLVVGQRLFFFTKGMSAFFHR